MIFTIFRHIPNVPGAHYGDGFIEAATPEDAAMLAFLKIGERLRDAEGTWYELTDEWIPGETHRFTTLKKYTFGGVS